jgi:hypothetical protein
MPRGETGETGGVALLGAHHVAQPEPRYMDEGASFAFVGKLARALFGRCRRDLRTHLGDLRSPLRRAAAGDRAELLERGDVLEQGRPGRGRDRRRSSTDSR